MDDHGRAWLLIAAANRSYAGNEGYDDDPSCYYSWDDQVPNHAAIRVGDAIAIWDKHWLLGVSVIHDIRVGEGFKTVRRCPACGSSTIKERRSKLPQFRCQRCRSEFDHGEEEELRIQTYRATHEPSWVDLNGLLDGPALRASCISPKSQHAMRALDWGHLMEKLDAVQPGTSRLLEPLVGPARRGPHIAGGHARVMVRIRIGQGPFRRQLLAEQGENCAFTGPTPGDALEAAHLYSYAQEARHETSGGLLLRRDLHRLFDLGAIAVRPGTQTLDVRESLRGYPLYGSLHGAPLPRAAQDRLTDARRLWLARHWALHRPQPELPYP